MRERGGGGGGGGEFIQGLTPRRRRRRKGGGGLSLSISTQHAWTTVVFKHGLVRTRSSEGVNFTRALQEEEEEAYI